MIKIKKAVHQNELDAVFDIRRTVFVDEQKCPPELEYEHEDVSVHFLATVDSKPAGAARWRRTGKGYKLERFAVLKEFRGMGVGKALVDSALADLPANANFVYLHAQVQACPLYEKSGFVKQGQMFEEAGIQHYKMVLQGANER